MLAITGTVSNIVSAYGRQQFYADRTAEIKAVSGQQIGVEDSVTLSREATVRQASSSLAPQVKPVRHGPITYDDPRKSAHTEKQEVRKRRESDMAPELDMTDQVEETEG